MRPLTLSAALALSFAASACSSAGPGSDPRADLDASTGPGAAPDSDTASDTGSASDSASEPDSRSHPRPAGDAGSPPSDAESPDALPDGGCFITTYGVFGTCISTTACAALGDDTSYPGYCPGSSSIECCTQTPSVSDNPPVPAGWVLMQQADVTPAMTTWAVDILDAPATYPMYSTTTMTFGALLVMARVEWHPPDFQNSAIHRGVTLYQQTD